MKKRKRAEAARNDVVQVSRLDAHRCHAKNSPNKSCRGGRMCNRQGDKKKKKGSADRKRSRETGENAFAFFFPRFFFPGYTFYFLLLRAMPRDSSRRNIVNIKGSHLK